MRIVPILALALLAGPALAAMDGPAPGGAPGAPGAGDAPAEAVFAGGCFWCMEPPFDKLDGVLSTTSGYTGGSVPDPTYEQVSAGGTGHREAVLVRYDPARVRYADLLEVYWRNVDPFDAGGQFCDQGDQYRSALYPVTAEQRRLAEESLRAVADRFGRPVATAVEPAAPFYAAESYHQDYYQTHPLQYRFYRFTCGRDSRLDAVWGTPAAQAPLVADAESTAGE